MTTEPVLRLDTDPRDTDPIPAQEAAVQAQVSVPREATHPAAETGDRHAETGDRHAPATAVDPLPELRLANALLDRAGIAHLILRGPGPLAARDRELDLLVAPGTFQAVARVLHPLGFREVLEPGRGTHRFLVRYDPLDDRWLKLDIVSELAYGARDEFLAASAAAVLERRTRQDGVPVIRPGDRLWATLLHRVGDPVGSVGPRDLDAGELIDAAVVADPWSPLAELFQGIPVPGEAVAPGAAGRPSGADRNAVDAGHGSGPHGTVALARRGEVALVVRMTRDALESHRRRHSRQVRQRSTRHRVRRLLRRLRSTTTIPRRPAGLVVALLGPDGAGKSALAAALAEETPLRVRREYLGLYGAEAGTGRLLGSTGLARLLRVARLSMRARLERRRGRVVVLDRHVYDLLDRGGPRRSRLRRALYLRAGVRPDLTIVLDAPAAVLHARRPEHGLQEADAERRHYRQLAATIPGAVVLDATPSPDAVAAEARRMLWDRLSSTRG